MSTDPKTAGGLARALDTSLETLTALTLSALPFVRDAALSNPSTPLVAVAACVPQALSSPSQVGVARAIAARADATSSIIGALVALFESEQLDGSRRENWRTEQLAIALLCHPNCSPEAAASLAGRIKLPRNVRSSVVSSAENLAVRDAVLHASRPN